MNVTCNCCGQPIRGYGTMCENCRIWSFKPDAVLKDGTPLYLKTRLSSDSVPLQLAIYESLRRKDNEG